MNFFLEKKAAEKISLKKNIEKSLAGNTFMKTLASVFYQITQLITILFYRFRAFVYTAMLCFFWLAPAATKAIQKHSL